MSELDDLMEKLGFRYTPSEGGYYIHTFVKDKHDHASLNSVLVPEVAKAIEAYISKHYIKKEDVLEAIGEDRDVIQMRKSDGNKAAFIHQGKNELRAEIKEKLNKGESNG